MKIQTVYILNVDRTKILEADFYKIPENKVYFLSFEDALNNLCLFKLEKLVGDFLTKDPLDYNLNKIKDLVEDIKRIREDTLFKKLL